MVLNVRCFKCGEQEVRLILGGRAIIHARCHACDSNLLAEIMELEEEVNARKALKAEVQTEAEDFDDEPSPTRNMAAISPAAVDEKNVAASN